MSRQYFLSILVPTYNRSQKLERLLTLLVLQRSVQSDPEEIEILVSNDGSKDETSIMLATRFTNVPNLQVFNQSRNLGQDGNVDFLFQRSSGQYVWFFGDDDVPFENALQVVVAALKQNKPTALLFSFSQPPGSPLRQFDYDVPYYSATRGDEIISLLRRYPKLSIYILRKPVTESTKPEDRDFMLGTNWYFLALVDLCFSADPKPSLGIISEQLASADEDWDLIRLEPHTWGALWKISLLPYFKSVDPHLKKKLEEESLRTYVNFLFSAKTGALRLENEQQYDDAIRDLVLPVRFVTANPKSAIKLLLLRFGLAPLMAQLRRNLNSRSVTS
jgi:glycosyltransferase involved in cell wall biosynthesis